jgi:putative hydrolase of the HAD superfamily
MTPPRALVLDLFGTLVPKWSTDLSTRARARMADHLGVEADAFHEAWKVRWVDRELGRIGLEENVSEIVDHLAPGAREGSLVRLVEIWVHHVREQLRPRADALALVQAAKAAGLRVGVLSNAGPTVPPIFRESEIGRLMDCTVFSCTAGVAKPHPRIYSALSEELAVPPEACVYVGDGADEELQGARSAGMTPVLLRVDSEIEVEGFPPGAAAWSGPVIHALSEIRGHLRLS